MKKVAFIVVATLALALSLTSCRVMKNSEKTSETTLTHRDTISHEIITSIDTVIVEQRSDSSNISIDLLKQIKEFKTHKNGVQTIIKYRNDSISAECICDQVEKLVASTMEKYFERQHHGETSKIESNSEKVIQKNGWMIYLIIAGIIVALIIVIILIKKYVW